MPMSKVSDGQTDAAQRWMTVAVVHEQAEHATVKFLESAMIYRLPRASADYASSLCTLQAAAGTGLTVCVLSVAPHSEIISSVRARR